MTATILAQQPRLFPTKPFIHKAKKGLYLLDTMPVYQLPSASRDRLYRSQHREWTVGPLSSATQRSIIMQFTGCHQPVKRSYWPENAIDWLA